MTENQEIKPNVILVQCQTWDQVEEVIAKAIEDEYYAIASAVGVMLIQDKERAISAFNSMLHTYIAYISENEEHEGVVPVLSMTTDKGTKGISYGVNTAQGGYLFGVSEEDYMASPTSHGFIPKDKTLN